MKTQNDYGYNGFLEAYPAVGPNTVVPNVYHSNPMPRDPQYRFFNDLKRTDEQTAFFAELTFPLTEKLDILFGARQYDLDIDYVGQSKFGGLAEGDSGRDYNSSGGHTDQPLNMKDTITKVTASYKMDEDTLIYFTQSEGYRPGGYNRGGGLTNSCAEKDPTADGYCGVGAGDNFRANPTTTFESDEEDEE